MEKMSLKKSKNWILILVLLLPILLISTLPSCVDIDEESEPEYYAFGNITSTSSGLTITTDSLKVLYSSVTLTGNTIAAGDRVVVYFKKISDGNTALGYDYKINILDISKISVQNILTIDQTGRDSLPDNSTIIHSCWVGGNYLNLKIMYYGLGNISHDFYVGYDPENQNIEGKTVLTLYHDTNNDHEYSAYGVTRSFRLDNFNWNDTEPHQLILRYKSNSSKIEDISLKYDPLVKATE